MTDNLEQAVARGHRAQALLADELLVGAFDAIRAEYLKFWETKTGPRATEEREHIWKAVQILGQVRSHLENTVANGTLAEHEVRALARGTYPAPQAVA
jgi:hypothetical protein